VQAYQADISIKLKNPDSANCCFQGTVTYEIRKHVPAGFDLHCDLSGNCDSNSHVNTESFSGTSPTGYYTFVKTFTPAVSGEYHFDVWYGSQHVETSNVALQGGGGTPSARCGESCGTTTCNKCEVCDFSHALCVPAEYLGVTCTCDTCYDSVAPNTGGCTCKSGACVESYAEECLEKGYVGLGCKCRPRENNYVYLSENGCLQTGCGVWPFPYYPREAACGCNSGCGAACGTNPDDTIKYCKASENCVFVQDLTGGDTAQGHCKCEAGSPCPPEPSGPCAGKDDMTTCTVGGQNGICCSQDCKIGGNCCSNNDCTGYDSTIHTIMVCECPNVPLTTPPKCTLTGPSYTCKPKPSCASNPDCDTNWCCVTSEIDSANSGKCVSRGIYSKPQWLCDPPNWIIEINNKNNAFLSLILSFFNPFS